MRSKAVQLLGTPRSGLPWHSGAWTGGRFTTGSIVGYGDWRGKPTDVVTTYSPNNPGDTYQTMMSSTWSIGTWDGFPGKLVYGLAPLPPSGEGSMSSIAADGVAA